jgi:UDP-glucose 4-epimerase
MIVLVTGAAGFIGSVVVETLIGDGANVIGIDTLKYGHAEAVNPAAQFVEADVCDAPALERIFNSQRIDAVVHLAAEAYIDESVANPGLFFEVNTSGGLTLLRTMAKFDCRKMVFSSTAAVYGEPVRSPIDERHPKDPVNAYGESKLQFERMLPWFAGAHGLQHVSFRYFNACGATTEHGEARRKETHIIPLLFDTANGKRPFFSLFGTKYATPDGTCIRDYVHVSDIADAHVLALRKIEVVTGEAYNLGSGHGNSNREVIAAVEAVTGKKLSVTDSDPRPGDPAILVASSEKARTELGWKPKFTDLESMVESAWRWRSAHPRGYA